MLGGRWFEVVGLMSKGDCFKIVVGFVDLISIDETFEVVLGLVTLMFPKACFGLAVLVCTKGSFGLTVDLVAPSSFEEGSLELCVSLTPKFAFCGLVSGFGLALDGKIGTCLGLIICFGLPTVLIAVTFGLIC